MCSTVTIDEALLPAAKEHARRRGVTLYEIVNQALQRELAREPASESPELPVFRGGTGPAPGIELTSNRALQELLDEDPPPSGRQ